MTGTRLEGVLLVRDYDTLPEGRGSATWWCPGCSAGHTITFGSDETWSWDGDTEHPTFAPSVLVFPREKLTAEANELLAADPRMTITDEHRMTTPRCHTFVRAGRIEYLTDCEHDLAGQTVDMVPLPDRYAAFLGE